MKYSKFECDAYEFLKYQLTLNKQIIGDIIEEHLWRCSGAVFNEDQKARWGDIVRWCHANLVIDKYARFID